MRPGELFFRAGSSLGGWIIAYGHAVMLAVIPATQCAEREAPDELWFAVLVMSIPALGALALIPLALPWRDSFRWLAVPLAPVLLFNATLVGPYLVGVTFGDQSLCGVLEPDAVLDARAGWQPFWAPLQLALIAGFAWRSFQYWKSAPADSPS